MEWKALLRFSMLLINYHLFLMEYNGSPTTSSSSTTSTLKHDHNASVKPNRILQVKLYVYLVNYVILLVYNKYTPNHLVNYINILCFFM
jgi:fatty acid desaturase